MKTKRIGYCSAIKDKLDWCGKPKEIFQRKYVGRKYDSYYCDDCPSWSENKGKKLVIAVDGEPAGWWE